MPTANGFLDLPVPPEKVAELARTAVARGGWRIDFVNTELCELAANQDKRERKKRVNWQYSYHLVIHWEESQTGSRIEIIVDENNYPWSIHKCQEKLQELATVMTQAASRYEKVKQTEKPRTKYGSARWGTLEDIKKAGYWGGFNNSGRLLLSPGEDQEYVSATEDDTIKHAIVVGPTGTGKTSSIFIPNLINRHQKSALVTEARAGNEPPDLFWKTAKYRAIVGNQKIYHFDPDNLRSVRINPLDSVNSYSDARNLAQLIVDNTTGKNNYGDDVWPKSEVNMLTTLIGHAAAQDLHLGYIRALLREGPEGMGEVIAKSPIEQVREDYRGFMNTSREGFRYGVIASLITRLGIWSSPVVVALTEKTDFDIDSLFKDRFTFYLSVPANKSYLKPVAALIFNYLLGHIQSHNFADPPFLVLDEFTNFGMIPDIEKKLSIIRHQKISFMLGFQDFAQLESVYERKAAENIRKQPRTRIFFRPADYEPAEAISKMAGKTTIFDRTMTSSGQIQERETGRWLIEPSEVMNLDEDKIIVFTPSTPPLMLPKFDWRDFEEATQFPPDCGPELEIDDQTIKECRRAKRKKEWQRTWEDEKRQEEEKKSDRGKAVKTSSGSGNKQNQGKRDNQKKSAGEPEADLKRKKQKPRKQDPEPKPKPETKDLDQEKENDRDDQTDKGRPPRDF